MKIRTIPENKVYAGTPKDIVRKMAADAIFLNYRTPEDYMRSVIQRLPSIQLKGSTEEERCESFINALIQMGAAKIDNPTSP